MAFATNQDFFSFVDNHRVFLLNCLPKEHESMMEEASRNATSQFQDTITSSQVLRAIESVIQDIVSSLSRNEPPFFTLNNRSSWGNIEFNESVGLQMISHCTTKKVRSDCPKSAQRFALILKILSMIYKLVQSNMYATKRDIYYTNVQLFGSQHIVDTIIDDISCLLKIPRRSLHILSTSKGCIAGDLCYTEDGTKVNCAGNAMSVLVPSNIQGITNMTSNAKFILIVEKDATFQRLLSDDFCNKVSPCIMITGKGVPDLNTRLLVRKLWDTFHIPIFTLVDADPYVNGHNPFVWTGLVGPKERKLSGIEIMCIYKYGSMSMSFDAHNLTVPSIRWLGILPSDIKRLHISPDALIPLTEMDKKKLASLQKRPYVACQPIWKKEMEIMEASNMKAEIQALTSLSSDYLSKVYLPNKLQYGGWI